MLLTNRKLAAALVIASGLAACAALSFGRQTSVARAETPPERPRRMPPPTPNGSVTCVWWRNGCPAG